MVPTGFFVEARYSHEHWALQSAEMMKDVWLEQGDVGAFDPPGHSAEVEHEVALVDDVLDVEFVMSSDDHGQVRCLECRAQLSVTRPVSGSSGTSGS